MKFRPALLLIALLPAACESIPKPTPEEIKVRDQWAAVVSPEARRKVMDEVDRHTGWAEKRKVLYEIDRYQHIYREEERKVRWDRSATRPTTRP